MIEAKIKTDSLAVYLKSLNHSFLVIAVTKTWGNIRNEKYPHLDSYNAILKK